MKLPENILAIAQEMNRQDNRATAHPLFMVEVEARRLVPVGDDYDERERVEEPADSVLCESCLAVFQHGEEPMPDECEKCYDDAFHHFKLEREINTEAGVFLTAEACNAYIASRHYAYSKPKSYAISAYWSEEMKTILRFLSTAASDDGKPAQQYR